ncbi:glutathione S-transferase family protein [Photobacterium atrarenae]|uniref:Glutathione S-transferase family protein n=1 Tax=Photobacterium atrarenae TaxID=865757 RepID=A0ABY5GPH2_9GAMM|nr:glutathione S-transferase family protein [Photobacterium atrarenae]UTV30641.1 glutathione S-transferase family protein [Photobacterium atrarenae]
MNEDMTPTPLPEGTVVLHDSNKLFLGEMTSTYSERLKPQRHPTLEINLVDPYSGKAFRLKGAAECLEMNSAAVGELSRKASQHYKQFFNRESASHDSADFEFIGSKLCPFAQRAVIILLHKQVDFRIRYVDLSDPPDWFLALSPNKKVPLLIVNNRDVIFESAVINELIDELTPNRLQPSDPIQNARNRSWIEFSSACFMDTLHMTTAETEASFFEAARKNMSKLEQVEKILGDGPYFNGAAFSLVDAAFAPLFMRLQFIDQYRPVFKKTALPKVTRWVDQLLACAAVTHSVVPEFQELYEALIWKRQGYLSHYLANIDQRPCTQPSLY